MKTGDLVHLKQPKHGVNRIGVVVGFRNNDDPHNPSLRIIEVLWNGGKLEGWSYPWFQEYHEVIQ